MWYNRKAMTLNGMTPKEASLPTPYTLNLAFFASDQEGYSALSSPFDIVVARHELSQSASSLPTMNFTADAAFSINLQSPSDFMGLLVDDQPLLPGNISTLALDTSSCPWLIYNEVNRSLSASALPPVQLKEDGCIHFNLGEFYAKDGDAHGEDADVSMTCNPSALSNEFSFDKTPEKCPALSAVARKRLHLGLGITFGMIGGMCLIAAGLAALRHCATVRDSALDLEANKKAWTEKDKKWYGIDSMRRKPSDNTSGYGRYFPAPPALVRDTPIYGDLGHGPGLKPLSAAGSNVMSKREFLTKIRDTVRQVSDQYQRILQGGPARPVIGKPILTTPPEAHTSPGPIDESLSYTPSGIDSSLNSPLRLLLIDRFLAAGLTLHLQGRPTLTPSWMPEDLARDRMGPVVHWPRQRHMQPKLWCIRRPEQRVYAASDSTPPAPPATRPRIVPFTSSTRVPVPRIPTGSGKEGGKSRRIPSQKAQIVHDTEKSGSGDDLSLGIRYVRALGADQRTVGTNASMPTVSTNVRSSFSSLESSHYDHSGPSMQRMLVRAEQKFHFRVPVFLEDSPTTPPSPKFLRADLRGKQQGSIEFYGTPGPADIADYDVEIYSGEDKCVARVAVEVVSRG
ncbi:MFS domain-containing protein [Salix suchowensis]|nr:MFS domain-containing protein [Salix suchowensis]